jgi:PKD repeat protein
VTVSIPAPTASFTVTQQTYDTTCYTFDATASSGYYLSYSWDFGDGNADVGSQTSHCYDYEPSQTYTVTLTITDQLGRTSTAQQSFYVNTGY